MYKGSFLRKSSSSDPKVSLVFASGNEDRGAIFCFLIVTCSSKMYRNSLNAETVKKMDKRCAFRVVRYPVGLTNTS